MLIILLVIHVLITIALVGVILMQKSEGGALGMGGGGMSGFMTGRSTANLLTRITAGLAAAFMLTSVLLVVLNNRARAPAASILGGATKQLPAPAAPATPVPTAPAAPKPPSAPISR